MRAWRYERMSECFMITSSHYHKNHWTHPTKNYVETCAGEAIRNQWLNTQDFTQVSVRQANALCQQSVRRGFHSSCVWRGVNQEVGHRSLGKSAPSLWVSFSSHTSLLLFFLPVYPGFDQADNKFLWFVSVPIVSCPSRFEEPEYVIT